MSQQWLSPITHPTNAVVPGVPPQTHGPSYDGNVSIPGVSGGTFAHNKGSQITLGMPTNVPTVYHAAYYFPRGSDEPRQTYFRSGSEQIIFADLRSMPHSAIGIGGAPGDKGLQFPPIGLSALNAKLKYDPEMRKRYNVRTGYFKRLDSTLVRRDFPLFGIQQSEPTPTAKQYDERVVNYTIAHRAMVHDVFSSCGKTPGAGDATWIVWMAEPFVSPTMDQTDDAKRAANEWVWQVVPVVLPNGVPVPAELYQTNDFIGDVEKVGRVGMDLTRLSKFPQTPGDHVKTSMDAAFPASTTANYKKSLIRAGAVEIFFRE